MPVAYFVFRWNSVALGQVTARSPERTPVFVSGRQIIRPSADSARPFLLHFQNPLPSFSQKTSGQANQEPSMEWKVIRNSTQKEG